jgi:hypothetical protein
MEEFTPERFDAASLAWRANKKRVGESWKYVCSSSGTLCKRVVDKKCFELDCNERLCSKHLSIHSLTENQREENQREENQREKTPIEKEKKPVCQPRKSLRIQVSNTASSQGTFHQSSQRLPQHIAESPTVPMDQGVAYRVVHRRRGNLSR